MIYALVFILVHVHVHVHVLFNQYENGSSFSRVESSKNRFDYKINGILSIYYVPFARVLVVVFAFAFALFNKENYYHNLDTLLSSDENFPQ